MSRLAALSKRHWLEITFSILLVCASAELLYLGFRLRALNSVVNLLESNQDVVEGQRLLPSSFRSSQLPSMRIAAGREYLVLYLSPRCRSCTKNAPAWRAIITAIGADNVLILSPGASSIARSQQKRYLSDQGLQSAASFCIDGTEITRSGLRNLPRTILLDRRGIVTKVWRGLVDPEPVLESWSQIKGGAL